MTGAKFSPHYSPDGKYLAFAIDLDGSESYHIGLLDLETNMAEDLTPHIAYAHQPNIAWAPDGKALAVLSDAKGQFALFLLPIDGAPPRLLWNVFHPCWDVVWSPDGQWIALESESIASDRSIHVIPVNRSRKGVRVKTIQLKINERVLNAQQPAWSPDSKFLAFSAELAEWHDIGLFNVDSQDITWASESVGDDTSPWWSSDGSRLGWVHAEGAATRIEVCTEPCRSVPERSGEIRAYQAGLGVHHQPQFTKNGKSLVFIFESPSQPPDLWNLNLDDGSFEQMTFSMPDDLKGEEFIHPEEIRYPGSDGVMIPALLYRAKDSERAVVNIHGGPNWNFQFMWHPGMSYMASRGWTVLAPNYRGSTGYGKAWQNASRFDMGGVDTRDCAAGVKYLIENRLADERKIAVTGRSHGGYLTMTCMTMFSELWAGGSAIVPFLNWFESHKTSREDLQHWNIENMGDPDEYYELWYARSPYFFLENINAPVQLICGANDPRCPASESISARDKLVELGREVDLVLYEDEGHAFLDIKNVIDSELRRIEF
ncbi:MAG: prolyl oligopeptidase family serine peptidase, partial [Chloroflexota bacterium]